MAVLGGGVGGLTAAHELAERGFDVTVYECRAWGGKARSMDVPGSARGGRRPLPAEHGWREVFSGYQNLPDTMRRIPFESNRNGVFDNLVTAPQAAFTRDGNRQPLIFPFGALDPLSYTPDQALDTLIAALRWLPPSDVEQFVRRLAVFLSSGNARRLSQWEHVSWSDFLQADRLSDGGRRLFVDFATRFAAAANGTVASARTIGKATESVRYLELTGRGVTRVLDAPTNEAWIDPWTDHLRRLGVRLHLNHVITRLSVSDGRITGAEARGPRGSHTIRADWYVCALPVERARRLWDDAIVAADPRLARSNDIPTGWMTGIQFYLREPSPIVHGPLVCLDSPWAISAVSQSQFWRERNLSRDYGDGHVREKLSTIICDWTSPGVIYGKPAKACSPEQVAREAWEQIKRHLRYDGSARLTDDLLLSWYLDPGLASEGGRITANRDPLFLPTVSSWDDRPPAGTAIPNLLLASDYVQVDFDITSMEGANEAARRAANAVLERAGSTAQLCQVFARELPSEWAALRALATTATGKGSPTFSRPTRRSRRSKKPSAASLPAVPLIFDEDSVTWRYLGDARFALLLGRVFLLQLLHPTVAAGVSDHSGFRTDPWGRLQKSWGLVLRTLYSPDGERVGAAVREAHKTISGTDYRGRRYHALEPEAYWWVLATGFDSMFTFAENFARPMTATDEDRAYDETRDLGRRFGLRDRDMPDTLGEFRDWYAFMLATRVEDNPTVRDFLDLITHPPAPPRYPVALWPPLRSVTTRVGWLITIGTIPAPTRESLGISWSRTQQAKLSVVAQTLRALGATPAKWRYLPPARRWVSNVPARRPCSRL